MKSSEKRVPVDPRRPRPEAIAAAGALLRSGGLVVYPTRCLYGLAAAATDAAAVERVYAVKRRPWEKPLSILIPGPASLTRWVRSVPPAASVLIARFWPGGLTLVFEDAGRLPERLTAGSGKIGIRLPSHPVAAALVGFLGGPITATSANRSGDPGAGTVSAIDRDLLAAVDRILDAGPLEPCPGSTIVDVTVSPVRILREGVIPAADVLSALEG